MRVCLDLDGTLCAGSYEECVPKAGARETLQALRDAGYVIALYTARGMDRAAGNPGKAIAMMAGITVEQLTSWGFVYDELHFGKPSGDIYVDDKSIPDLATLRFLLGISMPEFLTKSLEPGSQSVLEYRVWALEQQMTGYRKESLELLGGIDDKLSQYLERASAVETKQAVMATSFDALSDSVEDLDGKIGKLDSKIELKGEAIQELRIGAVAQATPGALAGGTLVAIVELLKYLTGHA